MLSPSVVRYPLFRSCGINLKAVTGIISTPGMVACFPSSTFDISLSKSLFVTSWFPLLIFPALACLLLTLALLCYLLWPTPDECLDHKDTYQYHWSTDKTNRCCARGFVPCITPEAPAAPVNRGPVDPFNCADGEANWPSEWSTTKKQWCCVQHGKGCGQDAEVPAAQYDCNSAFANWVKGWSEGKKGWCCSHGVKSCPGDAAAAGAGYGSGTQHGKDPYGAPVAAIRDIPHAIASSR